MEVLPVSFQGCGSGRRCRPGADTLQVLQRVSGRLLKNISQA